jgi:uncharacterized membrane protein
MTNATRIDWKIPLALLLISAIPFAAGVARLVGLASHTEINADNARFFAAPVVVVLHIVNASLFSVLGALQFSAGLRQRNPLWHRVSGRIVVASGVATALSGLWMTVMFPIPPALQGDLLYGVRLLVSIAMVISIVLAVSAVMRRDIAKHRAWMMRGYALGQGAGMQVVILLPWMLLIGAPSVLQRDLLMSLAWLVNLFFAEWVIQRQHQEAFFFYKVRP